jgi:signal transduction histidine kinase
MATASARRSDGSPDFKYVKFTIDAQLLRELGERLVGKPYVALGELVKNSYDADATRCVIRFGEDLIEIADDGNGMSYADFVSKWMRIGSPHKRDEKESPKFHRPLTGSKGIGRLSAQFLGASIEVISEPLGRGLPPTHAKVNWDEAYSKGSLIEAGAMVKDQGPVGQLPHGFKHGTCITIRGLKDVWTPELLGELAAEFWFLQPPSLVADDVSESERFRIELQGVSESGLSIFESQSTAALESWIAKIDGSVTDGRKTGKARVKVKFADGDSHQATYDLPNKSLDSAKFEILIFKLTGRQTTGITVSEAREYFKRFGGVHIYDSGFRLPFYGGGEQDWLQIEMAHSHRLIQSQLVPERLRPNEGNLQDLPTLSRVLGIVKVSTANEAQAAPKRTPPSRVLAVQVTRDRLIDNQAFADLVHVVRWAFDFYSYHSTSRRAQSAAKILGSDTGTDYDVRLDTVKQRVLELKQKVPPRLVEPLETALGQFEEVESRRRREADAERVLLGALATAGMGSVALQHDLSKELAALSVVVKDLEKRLSGADEPEVVETLKTLRGWLVTAGQTRKLFSPFFETEDRETLKRMRAQRVLERLASNLSPLMRGIRVEVEDVPAELRLPKGTLAGWNAVFQNLFTNAVNATLDSRVKRIRCRASTDGKGRARLVVEDTGVGADIEESEDLFKPFVRRLDLPEDRRALGLGGMGIGLTIARMVCRTFGCEVRFVKPRSPFNTAIEIAWEDSTNG